MITIIKKFNDFRKKWEGKRYDHDGSFGYQCVDLIRLWVKESQLPAITSRGNAIDLWEQGLGEGWERVNNAILAKPKPGAIIFWNIGKYGHVGVSGQSNFLWVEILEQNAVGTGTGTGFDAIRFRKDFYKKCLGWFNPKI